MFIKLIPKIWLYNYEEKVLIHKWRISENLLDYIQVQKIYLLISVNSAESLSLNYIFAVSNYKI